MFNKLKQIKDLRDKAKEIQGALATEIIDVDYKGIQIQMDGNQVVKFVRISPDLLTNQSRLETLIAEAFNEGIRKVQKAMAHKLSKMGNMDIPGLT
jgi:DNA-binding protein YbaB